MSDDEKEHARHHWQVQRRATICCGCVDGDGDRTFVTLRHPSTDGSG